MAVYVGDSGDEFECVQMAEDTRIDKGGSICKKGEWFLVNHATRETLTCPAHIFPMRFKQKYPRAADFTAEPIQTAGAA
jgi:hypothetical protein